MTIIQKILARAAGQREAAVGSYVTARIDVAMMPEFFRLIRQILAKAEIPEEEFTIWDPERFMVFTDHRVPPASTIAAENHKMVRELAKKLGVKYFYDIFPGVCHQVMVEKGHVRPGELIVGADSHTTAYGALNAAATGIGSSEMAYVMYTGELWFKVPETVKFEITGKLQEFTYPKDVVLHIAGIYGTEVARYKAIEWTGPVVQEMSIEGRLTVSTMSVELGAKFGIFKADEKTVDYVQARSSKPFVPVDPDPHAVYAGIYELDVSSLQPQVALPHGVANVKNVLDLPEIPIDQAVIGSCCNGRIEDLDVVAKILKGRKVHPGVRFYVAPASWEIYSEAIDRGILKILVEAGAMISNASCAFCSGFQGLLASGENCITATTRNFRGRMGSPEANIYLASPATVAASALRGKIVDPRELLL